MIKRRRNIAIRWAKKRRYIITNRIKKSKHQTIICCQWKWPKPVLFSIGKRQILHLPNLDFLLTFQNLFLCVLSLACIRIIQTVEWLGINRNINESSLEQACLVVTTLANKIRAKICSERPEVKFEIFHFSFTMFLLASHLHSIRFDYLAIER